MVKKKAKSSKSTAKKKTGAKKRPAKRSGRSVMFSTVISPGAQPVASRMRVYNLTREIPEDKYFILANGQQVKNVADLAAILDQLEDHVFNHHVNPDRNDFHNWVKEVFQDIELARKITGINDKKHMQLVIYRHMAGHD